MSIVFITIDGTKIPATIGEQLDTYIGGKKLEGIYSGKLILVNGNGEKVSPTQLLCKDETYTTRPPSHSEKLIEQHMTLVLVFSDVAKCIHFSSIFNRFGFEVIKVASIKNLYELAQKEQIDLAAIMFEDLKKQGSKVNNKDFPVFIIAENKDEKEESEVEGFSTVLYEPEFPEKLRDFAVGIKVKNLISGK